MRETYGFQLGLGLGGRLVADPIFSTDDFRQPEFLLFDAQSAINILRGGRRRNAK